MDIDEIPKPKHQHVLGENLEAISLDELAARIELLRAEITRLEVEKTRKQSSKATADAFFKS
jgi:uncharacterized small protein (DUF1192 family)